MQTVLSSLLAVTLGIHAMLGCCWHHAHDCTNCRTGRDQVAKASCCHGACHAHRHADEIPDDRDAAPKQPCSHECAGVCIYLGGIKSIDAGYQPEFDLVGIVSIDAPMVCVRLGSVNGVVDWLAPPPPLRLHLIQQVLLI